MLKLNLLGLVKDLHELLHHIVFTHGLGRLNKLGGLGGILGFGFLINLIGVLRLCIGVI